MKELFEYILIALACPLVLPLVEPQETDDAKMSENPTHLSHSKGS